MSRVSNVLANDDKYYNRIPHGFEQYNQFCLGTIEKEIVVKDGVKTEVERKKPVYIKNVKTGDYRGLKYTTETDKYMSAQQACELLAELDRNGHTRFNLCFIITENDSFVFLDYDDAFDPESVKWSDEVMEAYRLF